MKKNIIPQNILVLLFLLLIVVGGSCRRMPPLNEELSTIDRMVLTDPGTGYKLICKFDTSRLLNGRDSAMYSLLMSELRDKNYSPDTVVVPISKAAIYFKLNGDPYNAMRAYFYKGVVALNVGAYGVSQSSLMEALSQSEKDKTEPYYYRAKIFEMLSELYQMIGEETKQELYARKSYEEYCQLDSTVFIVQSKLWWANTLGQTGNPAKSDSLATQIYEESSLNNDEDHAAQALDIMARSSIRLKEYEKSKMCYDILMHKYKKNFSLNDLNLYLLTMLETGSPADSIEILHSLIRENTAAEEVIFEYYERKGDYKSAVESLKKELAYTENKFGMRLRNDAGVELDNWHAEKMMEAENEVAAQKMRSALSYATALLSLISAALVWLVMKLSMRNRVDRLKGEMAVLKAEGDRLRNREMDLSEKICVYRDKEKGLAEKICEYQEKEQDYKDREKNYQSKEQDYRTVIETYMHRMEELRAIVEEHQGTETQLEEEKRRLAEELRKVSESTQPKTNGMESKALDLWFERMNELYGQYYIAEGNSERSKNLMSSIKREMDYFRKDEGFLWELEDNIDSATGGMLSQLYGSLKRVTSDQRRLLAFLFFGFSMEAICAVFEINPKTYYNRKSRLLKHLRESSLPDKENIIRQLTGRHMH